MRELEARLQELMPEGKRPGVAQSSPYDLSRAIVLASMILAGAAILCVVLVTDADWFYPTVFFGLAAFVVWQRYF
jgi:hypothetical protein